MNKIEALTKRERNEDVGEVVVEENAVATK